MIPSLMKRFIRLGTAHEIWEALSKTFYDGSDETRIFELNRKSFTTLQNGRPLSTYYNELIAIFQESDHRSTTQEVTVEGVTHLSASMKRLRVHIFLSGLVQTLTWCVEKFCERSQNWIFKAVAYGGATKEDYGEFSCNYRKYSYGC
ncbi:hypothetical protein ACLB2K_007104 [Fragaria x ananassa]